MKHNILSKALVVTAIATATATPAIMAQNLQTGYFNDEYVYRFQMNPALANEHNFISMPGLGNLNVGLNGSIGIGSLVHNVDGKTTTLLNPNVSVADALSPLSNSNSVNVGVRETVLATGFKGLGGYNTITIGARANVGAKVPREVFALLKQGVENKTYDISGVGAYGNAFAEVALGHSHKLNDEWRLGASVKLLVGAADFRTKLDQAQLALGTDNWTITAQGQLNAHLKGMKYSTTYNRHTSRSYVSGFDFDDVDYTPSSYGVGFDVGLTYSPAILSNFTFSAAVLDIGFIDWSNDLLASTDGLQTVSTDKYTFSADSDASNSFSNEWKRLRNAVSDIWQLHDLGDQGSARKSIGATVNVGASYIFPLYRQLSFGLLNTTRINGEFSWTDFRLSANVAPSKVFSASASVSAGSFGYGFGWLINIHPKGFNLFVAMDSTPTKLSAEGIPLASNTTFNLGINFPF